MKRLSFGVAAAVLILALDLPLHAQDAPAGPMSQTIVATPLPGHAGALEAGAMRHMEWYAGSGGGSWTWLAFQVIMGERTGQYVWVTGGHSYADFDMADVDPSMSNESIAENITPHVTGVRVALLRANADLGIAQTTPSTAPLYKVLTFTLKPGADARFGHVLAKLKEAFGDSGIAYTVFQSAQGGNGQWIVSIPHENFASMDTDPSLFPRLMTAAHGEYEATALLESLGEIVASQTSEILAFRPDLSVNVPGG